MVDESASSKAHDPEPLAWLLGLLADRSEVEREDFIAAVLLNAGFEENDLDGTLQALMERFAIRADIQPGSPGSVNQQIAEYFELNPLDEELVKQFETRFRGDLLKQQPHTMRETLQQLGQEAAGWTDPEPAPEGSHSGGALGYFAARSSFDRR
ncbi:MAG: hypothetical protein AAFN74_16485 [Myxococcota bacterium]